MAESSWPGPGPATVTEHQHELLWSAYYQTGLVGRPSDPSLVFGDSSGLQVKVRPDRYGLVQGQMWTSGPTELAVPLASNASGQTRQDRIVLRLDRATWLVTVEVVQGTPGSGVPALTQDFGPSGVWELLLANVTVADAAATINPADVDSRNTYLGPPLLLADRGELISEDVPFPQHFLRYDPDEDRLQLHTQGNSLTGRRTLYEDTGWVNLGGASGGFATIQNSWIRKRNAVVTARFGTWDRVGGSVSAGSDVLLLHDALPSEFRPGGSGGESVDGMFWLSSPDQGCRAAVYNEAHSTRAGQLWLVNHPGFSSNVHILGTSMVWLVEE